MSRPPQIDPTRELFVGQTPGRGRRFVTCPNCSEHFTPPKANRKKPTRYLPPDERFVSWINARSGTASISAIARRFNLRAAERDILLSRLTAAGAGLVLHHHGRGGGRRFVLLRTPRQPTMPPL